MKFLENYRELLDFVYKFCLNFYLKKLYPTKLLFFLRSSLPFYKINGFNNLNSPIE